MKANDGGSTTAGNGSSTVEHSRIDDINLTDNSAPKIDDSKDEIVSTPKERNKNRRVEENRPRKHGTGKKDKV
jgi:hypothetical protein